MPRAVPPALGPTQHGRNLPELSRMLDRPATLDSGLRPQPQIALASLMPVC